MFLSGNFSLQPATKKEIELQVVDVPSIINLQKPFRVILIILCRSYAHYKLEAAFLIV